MKKQIIEQALKEIYGCSVKLVKVKPREIIRPIGRPRTKNTPEQIYKEELFTQ